MSRVLTLLYHRVINLEYDKNLLAVSPDIFYEQMLFLKKNYPIVRFEQDWNGVTGDAVCVTFDDGYMDNFTNALPILEDLDIPFTVFIVTGNINTHEEFWWDELERILLDRQKIYDETFTLEDELFSCQWLTGDFSDREELYDTLHWLIYNKITVEKRKKWMDQLRKWSRTESIGRKENWAMQVYKIKEKLPIVTIGAHTVNHPSLKNLMEWEQRYEINQSIKELEYLFKRNINVFSYPFGTRNDYDKTTINICKEENIYKAAVNIPGVWTPYCDRYQIPRNIVRNWSISEFTKKLNEFWSME